MDARIKRAPLAALGLLIATGGLGPAHAATNAELEQRIDRLEQMLRDTRSELEQRDSVGLQEQAAGFGNDPAPELDDQSGEVVQSEQDDQSLARQSKTDDSKSDDREGYQLTENTSIKIGGYVKFDAVYQDASAGTTSDTTREFYIPSRVPVGDDGGSQSTDFNARQTRFNITSITNIGGHKIRGFIETDFYGSKGSEVTSNASEARVRHVFMEIDDTWLFGQTWSNFMDLRVFPETLDFFASAESIGYSRQPQIRYTNGNFSVALENPETQFDVDPGGDNNTALTPEEDFPELTASYNIPTSFGHLNVGGVVRQVSNEGVIDSATSEEYRSDEELGYGVRLSGSIDLGESGDQIGFSGIYGDGLGRYVGLGITPAGYVNSDGSVETIPYVAGYTYLRHYWSDEWRSNFVIGTQQVDNDSRRGGTATKSASSVHANLLWNPVEPLTLGGEVAYAEREVENGLDGNITRFQMSAKYAF